MDRSKILIQYLIIIFSQICLIFSEESFTLALDPPSYWIVLLALFQLFLVNCIGRDCPEYKLVSKIRESALSYSENKKLEDISVQKLK